MSDPPEPHGPFPQRGGVGDPSRTSVGDDGAEHPARLPPGCVLAVVLWAVASVISSCWAEAIGGVIAALRNYFWS